MIVKSILLGKSAGGPEDWSGSVDPGGFPGNPGKSGILGENPGFRGKSGISGEIRDFRARDPDPGPGSRDFPEIRDFPGGVPGAQIRDFPGNPGFRGSGTPDRDPGGSPGHPGGRAPCGGARGGGGNE